MIKKILALLTILTLIPFALAEETTTPPPTDTTTTPPPTETPPADTTIQPADATTTPPAPETPPADTTIKPADATTTPSPTETAPVPPTEQTSIPSEQPAIQVPEGCNLVTDSRGMQVVRCPPGVSGSSCPSSEEMQAKADECAKSGGRVEKHSDQQGCTYISCAFGGQQYGSQQQGMFFQPQQQFNCPPPEEMSRVKDKCISLGMTAVMKRVGECSFVECAGAPSYRYGGYGGAMAPGAGGLIPPGAGGAMPPPGAYPQQYPQQMPPQSVRQCKPINQDPQQEEECRSKGGNLVKRFDPQGCTFLECMQGQQAQEFCQKEVPKDFFEKCTQRGGEPVSKRDSRGCVMFFNCVMRGDDRSIEYEDIQEVPPAAKILEAVLKMERLKMQLTKLEGELESIAKYYEDNNNNAEAERFLKAAGMIGSSQEKISSIKADLRNRAAQLTIQDVMNTKRDLKYMTEVLFKDVLYVILGAEGTAGENKEVGGIIDCGSDGRCFEQNFRICSPAKFMPPGDQFSPTITIKGLNTEDKTCKLHAEQQQGGDMNCMVPNYAFARLDPQSIIPYCEGPLVDTMNKFGMQQANVKDEKTYERQLMGCEKVERGFAGYERGKCGNECCEPALSENEQNCPKDCQGGYGGATSETAQARNDMVSPGVQEDRRNLERPMPPPGAYQQQGAYPQQYPQQQYPDYGAQMPQAQPIPAGQPMQPIQPLPPLQPMPPGYSSQMQEPTTGIQNTVANTGYAVRTLIKKLVGEEL